MCVVPYTHSTPVPLRDKTDGDNRGSWTIPKSINTLFVQVENGIPEGRSTGVARVILLHKTRGGSTGGPRPGS